MARVCIFGRPVLQFIRSQGGKIVTFRCRRFFLIQGILLALVSLGAFYIVGDALLSAEGTLRLILLATASMPLLVAVVAILRLLTALTLSITLTPDKLLHRQIFKNYDVLVKDLVRVEVGFEGAGRVMVLKLFIPGGSFYIDGAHVEGVLRLKAGLEQYLPSGRVVTVDTFTLDEAG